MGTRGALPSGRAALGAVLLATSPFPMDDPSTGQQEGTCLLLVPTLGHLLKTSNCSALREVLLGLKELELTRVELGLIKS